MTDLSAEIDNLIEWFMKYASREKREIETLFAQLKSSERDILRQKLGEIFTTSEDIVSMSAILDNTDVLKNSIYIAIRSISNGDNLESHIIKNIPFECVKFAFLIIKRHLTLYAQIEKNKNKTFFNNSDYQSIYGFCSVFYVPNKLSVLLMNSMNITTIEDWFSFDKSTNEKFCEILNGYGCKKFSEMCLMVQMEDSYSRILSSICNSNCDVRLQLKLIHLHVIIKLFKEKWTFIYF